jgi:Zn-dependent peptidase ImmA (M78 family)
MGEITGKSSDYAVTCYKDRFELAIIYLNTEVKYYDWDKPEYTILHELIHIMFHNVDEYVRDNIEKKELYTTLEERFINIMSYTMFKLFDTNCVNY